MRRLRRWGCFGIFGYVRFLPDFLRGHAEQQSLRIRVDTDFFFPVKQSHLRNGAEFAHKLWGGNQADLLIRLLFFLLLSVLLRNVLVVALLVPIDVLAARHVRLQDDHYGQKELRAHFCDYPAEGLEVELVLLLKNFVRQLVDLLLRLHAIDEDLATAALLSEETLLRDGALDDIIGRNVRENKFDILLANEIVSVEVVTMAIY